MNRITVDLRSRTPIYEQLIHNIEGLVLRGILQADEAMPSVRALAAELGINPNTIQKSYAELERRGVIYSVKGRGSFVSGNTNTLFETAKEATVKRLRDEVLEAKKLGLSEEDVLELVKSAWREGGESV